MSPSKHTNKVGISVDVIGLGFRLKKDVRTVISRSLQSKSIKVDLRRELDNKYDENAIMVIGVGGRFDEVHLGYLRRTTAAELAPKLDAGEWAVVSAKLTALYGQDDNKSGNVDAVLEDLR